MSTFLETQGMRMQEHFEVLEIDLPVITGACTIGAADGFGTPLSCDQAWTGEYKTYKFTNKNCPVVLPGSPWRLIKKISETSTELKPGEGLSSRGSLNITFSDVEGQDPNVGAPGVTDVVRKQGTFFGKLARRQIFENKKVRLKLYRVQPDGSVDLVNGAQTRNYIADTFKAGSNGQWSLSCKDVLSLANISEKTWPVATESTVRLGFDDTVTEIPVDAVTNWDVAEVIRIGDEFMRVLSVNVGGITNFFPYSNDFTTWGDPLNLWSISSTGNPDPLSGNDAYHMVLDATPTLGNPIITSSGSGLDTGLPVNISFWFKLISGTINNVYVSVAGGPQLLVPFTPSAAYQRVSVTTTIATAGIAIDINPVGVIGAEFSVFGAQLENSSIAHEYVETTGSPATSPPADPTLTVDTRGSSIVGLVSGETLTTTRASEHDAGDEVFICKISDDETIDSLLSRVLTDSDLDGSYIPSAEWASEVAQWHANDKINTLHSESKDVNTVLKNILTDFLMDMWFSTTENLVKLSAISVWKGSSSTLVEGREVNAYSIKKTAKESLRASRALVVYDKRNLADDDSVTSFKKASQFADNTIISDALYSKHKDKKFDRSALLSKDAADLLAQRYVSRFKFTPYIREFVTDERHLNFNTGDVVDLRTNIDQAFDGSTSSNIRSQILKINPQYTKTGRNYKVSAMTYEAAFEDGSQIVLDSALSESNLYILAGAPSESVTITFVLTNYSFGATGFRAGNFPSGSKIILILANGFDGQANGGRGGHGGDKFGDPGSGFIVGPVGDGTAGGVVYDAMGVDTDIYFSGATPSAAPYDVADGYIRAPSGGDAGSLAINPSGPGGAGDGGDGGDGRLGGVGGRAGLDDEDGMPIGTAGVNGKINGTGSGWGNAGINNDGTGGAAGSGIIDSGATVTLFGDTPARYINGSGDHP